MAIFVLSESVLKTGFLGPPRVELPELEVSDARDDYGSAKADGVWIRDYIEFMEGVVRNRCGLPNFAFSDDYQIHDELFDEIPSPHVRALLIEFTNRIYPDWKDDGVDLPDYDDIREGCRSYCEDCDLAYEETYGTYDGDLPEDVAPDEDVNTPGISEKEKLARRQRNAERAAERQRRQQAQDEAESEVVDRNWACDDDCDAFIDYVDERFRENTTVDTEQLDREWESFLAEKGERDFPPLIVELARQGA